MPMESVKVYLTRIKCFKDSGLAGQIPDAGWLVGFSSMIRSLHLQSRNHD
jgi:hypothetical protein